MFAGKSTLRAKETTTAKVDPVLQAYLKRYESSGANGSSGAGNGGDGKKKRKKKKPALSALAGGVRIVDESVTGFAPATAAAAQPAEDEDDDDDYGVPVLANAEEAELAARQVEAAKMGFYGTGSGWQAQGDNAGDEARPRSGRPRHDSVDDASPPRRAARHDSDSDAEPVRRRPRYDSGSDAEPARRRPAPGSSDSDAEPARRPRQRHDSDSDAEPPRRSTGARAAGADDADPPRRPRAARHDSDGDDDAEPPRRLQGRHDSDSDASPPRPKRGRPAGAGDGDLSPPRKRPASAPSPAGTAANGTRPAGGRTMTDGTATGMITAGELKAELDRKRAADREEFARLDAATTGRGAETVYRDKEGKIVSRAELEAARKAELEKKEKERETPGWAGGLKQQREAAERSAAMAAEAAKPFARTKDDRDLDDMYRNQSRFGDPMAQYVRRRQSDDPPPVALPTGKKRKAGFVVPQGVPPHSWLKRRIGPPINRYSIKPGRHWDGVDRSNGFEAKMFRTKNERSFIDGLAFSYGQEDM